MPHQRKIIRREEAKQNKEQRQRGERKRPRTVWEEARTDNG